MVNDFTINLKPNDTILDQLTGYYFAVGESKDLSKYKEQ